MVDLNNCRGVGHVLCSNLHIFAAHLLAFVPCSDQSECPSLTSPLQ